MASILSRGSWEKTCIWVFEYPRWKCHIIIARNHRCHTACKAFSRPILHYNDVIMISSVSMVYSTFCSGADQRKHQSFASLAFVRGIHRWLLNSPYKGPVTREMFPFDDVIMKYFLALKIDRQYGRNVVGLGEQTPSTKYRISTHWGQDKMADIFQTIF